MFNGGKQDATSVEHKKSMGATGQSCRHADPCVAEDKQDPALGQSRKSTGAKEKLELSLLVAHLSTMARSSSTQLESSGGTAKHAAIFLEVQFGKRKGQGGRAWSP